MVAILLNIDRYKIFRRHDAVGLFRDGNPTEVTALFVARDNAVLEFLLCLMPEKPIGKCRRRVNVFCNGGGRS